MKWCVSLALIVVVFASLAAALEGQTNMSGMASIASDIP